MTTLVIGGAASGKSAFAEELLLKSVPAGVRRLYLATMEPYGAEGAARVARHRELRAGKGFETLERYVDLRTLPIPEDCGILLECVGNLCANELYSPHGSGDGAEEAVVTGIIHLMTYSQELVVVSNEVCLGGSRYLGDTARYLRLMGRVNQALCALSDNVCEVVCGVPVWYKGGEP